MAMSNFFYFLFFERERIHIFRNSTLRNTVGLVTLVNFLKPQKFLQAWPLKNS